jgi:hypothetical protein
MDLSKINKFKNAVSSHKYVTWDFNFKALKPEFSVFTPGKNYVIVVLDLNTTIIYNNKTSKITCIFLDEIDYIQTEFYLLKPMKIITPYVKFMVTNIPNPSKCLVIGLCLGNVPNALIGLYSDINRIDCVDVNKVLCKFYKKYLCVSSSIHVYCMGGYKFVKTTKRTYSTVFIDIPCAFITKRFMGLIDKITKPYPDRIIKINVIGENDCKKINENLFSNFTIKSKQIQSNLIYVLN